MLTHHTIELENVNPQATKPWVIIGAGPVGAMQAVIFAALFPGQKIYVLDRYHKHVRGHGLQIWNGTIKNIVQLLNKTKKQLQQELKQNPLENREQRLKIISNIDKTTQFLNKEFTGFLVGSFIRTHKISELLQNFAANLSEGAVELRLDNEVTEAHLKSLTGETASPLVAQQKPCETVEEKSENRRQKAAETHEILTKSSLVFGADGAHSRFRELAFGESDADLEREVVTYLVEIKLDMKKKARFFRDLINRSVAPTIARRNFHFWSQGKDDTATLHIFANKKVFEALRGKKYKDKAMGEFTNPYRRLADLPAELQEAFESELTQVLGIDQFKAKTLKITTIPMGVYKARELVKEQNGRLLGLVGDAGIGLVLARGVNNGLNSAAEYGVALFNYLFKKTKNKEARDDFSSFNLGDTELHQAQKNIKERADREIKKIKREAWYIGDKHLGPFFSPYEIAPVRTAKNISNRESIPLHGLLKHLKATIPHFDYEENPEEHNKYAKWLLHLDRLYKRLALDVKTLEQKPDYETSKVLAKIIIATRTYVQGILSAETPNTEKLELSLQYIGQLHSLKINHRYLSSLGIFRTTDLLGKLARNALKVGLRLIHKDEPQPYSHESKELEALNNLNREIHYFKNLHKTKPECKPFIKRLKNLYADLVLDLGIQKAKGNSIEKILASPTIKVCYETTELLQKLGTHTHKKDRLQLIHDYEKNCQKSYGAANLMKAVAAVVITGVGFVLGAVLGVSIGFLAGVWSGPGAAFTGALGLFKGAITGAAIGLTAATAVTGLTAGAISGYLLFKPTGLVKQFGDLSTKAKKMAESPALAGNSEILEEEKCPRP